MSLEKHERSKSQFPSVNVIYEENIRKIDIDQLELESERLMESIAQMDYKNKERRQSLDKKRLSKSIPKVELIID